MCPDMLNISAYLKYSFLRQEIWFNRNMLEHSYVFESLRGTYVCQNMLNISDYLKCSLLHS